MHAYSGRENTCVNSRAKQQQHTTTATTTITTTTTFTTTAFRSTINVRSHQDNVHLEKYKLAMIYPTTPYVGQSE
jgi:hypothetical protein